MQRRTLLTAAATGLVAGTGTGCLGAGLAGNGSTPTDDGSNDTDTIDDVGCPSFVDVDRTNCYRTLDQTEATVFVAPSALTFEDYRGNETVETVTFTLENTGDRPFRFNPNAWTLYAYQGSDWQRLAPEGADGLADSLAPGATVTWSLATEQRATTPTDARPITATLDSGSTHAFQITGTYAPEAAATRIEAVAVFDYLKAVP